MRAQASDGGAHKAGLTPGRTFRGTSCGVHACVHIQALQLAQSVLVITGALIHYLVLTRLTLLISLLFTDNLWSAIIETTPRFRAFASVGATDVNLGS